MSKTFETSVEPKDAAINKKITELKKKIILAGKICLYNSTVESYFVYTE